MTMKPMYKGEDQTGKMFGLWKVLDFAEMGKTHHHKWKVLCTGCNTTHISTYSNITSGKSTNCMSCSTSGEKNGNWKGYKSISSSYYTQLKHGAIKRGIKFDVTKVELHSLWEEQEGKCALTGSELQLGVDASIDRIDSSKHYTIGNLQWVDKDINMMKRDFNQDYFLDLCYRVAKHEEKK